VGGQDRPAQSSRDSPGRRRLPGSGSAAHEDEPHAATLQVVEGAGDPAVEIVSSVSAFAWNAASSLASARNGSLTSVPFCTGVDSRRESGSRLIATTCSHGRPAASTTSSTPR
ncbi:MAG: hypothetical protein ACLGIA_02595, partial [Actinomycetes bacterium]